MAKSFTVCCPDCGVNFTASYGLFHKKETCPNCRRVIDLKNEVNKVISCPHCGSDSVYNARFPAPATCLKCGQSLEDPAIKARYREVNCPKCGQPHTLLPGSGMHECIACGAEFDVDKALARMKVTESDAVTIFEQNDAPGKLVWKHPNSTFPYNAQLNIKSGTRAVCSLGGGTLYHGSHALKEVLSGLLPELPDNARGQLIRTDVYFVRETIDKPIPWGTANCPVFPGASAGKTYEAYASGSLTLRISDPGLLLGFVGYGEHTAESLVGNLDLPTRAMVRGVVNDAFSRACNEMLESSPWTVERIGEHTTELRQELIDNANIQLEGYGLQISFLEIKELGARLSTFSSDRAKALRTIRHQVEAGIEWETASPVHIHMRGMPTRSAELTLGGKIILSVLDEDQVMNKADVWVLDDASGTGVRRYLSNLFSNMLLNPLHDILQAMIDETNADIRELTPYYHHLRNSMANYLNRSLAEWGLEVSVFMLHQSGFHPSNSLRTLTQNADVMDTKTLEAEMAAFTREYEFKEYEQDAIYKGKKLEVDVQAHQQEVGAQIAHIDLDDALKDKMAQSKARGMQREAGLNRLGKDISAEQRAIDTRQKADQDMLELDIAERIAERRGQLNASEQQRAFDQMYARWKNSARFEQEKLNDQMLRDNAVQEHNIHMDSRAQEADRSRDRADAEQQRILYGILRSIEQSEFDWQQKQDAYARLLRSQQADDRARILVQQAHAETDAEYLRKHLNLKLTDEEAQLLENIARNEEARAERLRRAEFAQEMEQRRQETGMQMELLRVEFEQQEKLAKAAKEIADQQVELEKLRLTLQHYEAMGEQGIENTRIRENSASIRHQAELAYQQSFAVAARKEESDRLAAQEAAEADFADRAERLLTTMWSIQASLDGMQLENEREYNAGRARVDQTAAQHMSDEQLRQLTSKIDGLSQRLKSVRNAVREHNNTHFAQPAATAKQTAPVQPTSYNPAPVQPAGYTPVQQTGYSSAQPAGYNPVQSTNPAFGGSYQYGQPSGYGYTAPSYSYQPAATAATCPYCGKSLPAGSTFCSNCGNKLKQGY